MFRLYNGRFKSEQVTIFPGEMHISSTEIIHTLLGTCIAVVLYSDYYKTGGMNHFMLPYNSSLKSDVFSELGRYGETAMEMLVNGMIKKGIYRNRLKAKVFGGGRMLDVKSQSGKGHVGEQNVDFIKNYLEVEGIPIESEDVGGDGGRKIFFFPWTGRVLLSRIISREIPDEYREKEMEYLAHQKEERKTKIFLFDQKEA